MSNQERERERMRTRRGRRRALGAATGPGAEGTGQRRYHLQPSVRGVRDRTRSVLCLRKCPVDPRRVSAGVSSKTRRSSRGTHRGPRRAPPRPQTSPPWCCRVPTAGQSLHPTPERTTGARRTAAGPSVARVGSSAGPNDLVSSSAVGSLPPREKQPPHLPRRRQHHASVFDPWLPVGSSLASSPPSAARCAQVQVAVEVAGCALNAHCEEVNAKSDLNGGTRSHLW